MLTLTQRLQCRPVASGRPGALSAVIILFPFPVPGVNPSSHSCFLPLPWERLHEGQERWESQATA